MDRGESLGPYRIAVVCRQGVRVGQAALFIAPGAIKCFSCNLKYSPGMLSLHPHHRDSVQRPECRTSLS